MSAVEKVRARAKEVVSNVQSRVQDVRGRVSQKFPVLGQSNQSTFPMVADLKTRIKSRSLFRGFSPQTRPRFSHQIRPNIPAVPKEPPKMELSLGMANPPVPVQPITVDKKIYV